MTATAMIMTVEAERMAAVMTAEMAVAAAVMV